MSYSAIKNRRKSVPVKVGHVTVGGMRVLGNCHFIDTGGWRPTGTFTVLDLHTLKPLIGPKAEPRGASGIVLKPKP